MQLAGHLRGWALQKWNLLHDTDKGTFETAVSALQGRLDPGSKTMAAQDFRHATQGEGESVSDFIRRLERTFHLAYGRDGMQLETRDALSATGGSSPSDHGGSCCIRSGRLPSTLHRLQEPGASPSSPEEAQAVPQAFSFASVARERDWYAPIRRP